MNWKRPENKFGTKLGRCGATGKVIFRTEGAAKKRIKEILMGETNRCHNYLRSFPCIRCGYWHLTSKPNERQQYVPTQNVRPVHEQIGVSEKTYKEMVETVELREPPLC